MKKFKDLKVGDCIYGCNFSMQSIFKYVIVEKKGCYVLKVKEEGWAFTAPVTVNMDAYKDGDLFSCVEALFNSITSD